MSGKAPPRAPRALLHSFTPSGPSNQPTNPTNPRLGAPPPTGPRSLQQRLPPLGPKTPAAKPQVNGHPPQPNASVVPAGHAPSTGPSARLASYKGKQVDASIAQLAQEAGSSSSDEVKCSCSGTWGSPTELPPPPPSLPLPRPPSPPKLYSLPPPPPWPPARSEYPEGPDFKLLLDPHVPTGDKNYDVRLRVLRDKLRDSGSERVKGKTKGKELLYRYNGEVSEEGEEQLVLCDPRKASHGTKRLPSSRPARNAFIEVNYEYDTNSCGPPPPTAVLIMNVSPLTSNSTIRRHFGSYGPIVAFEPQINKATGAALGVILIRYGSHEEAVRCVAKEHGKKGASGIGNEMVIIDGELTAVLDGEGKLLAAVMKELDERKRQEREEKERKRQEDERRKVEASTNTPSSSRTPSNNPWRTTSHLQGQQSWTTPLNRPNGVIRHPLPPIPPPSVTANAFSPTNANDSINHPARVRRPPPSNVRTRLQTMQPGVSARMQPHLSSHSSSSTPVHWRGRRQHPAYRRYERDDENSVPPASRSPSPISRRLGGSSKSARQREHEVVVEELAKNGFDYVTLEGQGNHLGGTVREEDVRFFFKDFEVDRVLQDHSGWYVTFRKDDAARRSAIFLNSGTRTLAQHSVNVTIHAAPAFPRVPTKTRWTDSELVEQAEKIILNDLKAMLEKDVMERIVGTELRRVFMDEKSRRRTQSGASVESGRRDLDPLEKIGLNVATNLKGLSFRKETKRAHEEPKAVIEEPPPASPMRQKEVAESEERPKKKPKKAAAVKVVPDEDVESEDDVAPAAEEALTRKRAASLVSEPEQPVAKKVKKPKKAKKVYETDEVVHEVFPETFDVPVVAQLHLPSSPSPQSSPILEPQLVERPVTPVDPFKEGICEDDEDSYFVKLAILKDANPERHRSPSPVVVDEDERAAELPAFRVHVTGSARTEGYYKISHAEKAAYVAQYANRTAVAEDAAVVWREEVEQPKAVTSSRSNRANARRRAQGLEEINMVQRAMALSKGESAATELVKFNQLQTRKKHMRFARSPIHDWGLYAMEKISRGEMVIEYVGEVIRAQVADKREKAYERQGIGSSYLFRIDEDLVVDATKKGNLGRLINHSCDPNCTAKIITINGEKKIVIYAKQDIELGSEITYDYHFPIEQDKIPCLCGSAKCRGYLN
ncbi:hypothetical protein BC835DRAFT_1535777 [Cytidiella melzeri]|nr:hypothetical protein BC835DRAFT_1535777 [Cytidiella melzeri]